MANVKFSSGTFDKANIRRQSEHYNRSYIEWRKKHNRTLGFYPDSSFVYASVVDPDMDLHASETGSFERRAEFAAYRRTLSFIGGLLVIFSVAAILFAFIIPFAADFLTDYYTYDFFSGHLYGSGGTVLSLVLAAGGALTAYIAMIAVGVLLLKIPVNVIFPMTVISKRLCVSGVLIAPMLGTVSLILRRVLGFPAFTLLFGNVEPKGFTITRIIIYMILIPVLSELAFRGVLLTLLRQFGDVSAVITTALLSSTATCAIMGSNLLGIAVPNVVAFPLAMFPGAFFCSLCYGYFTFASGSVITPIIMKMIVSAGNIFYLAIHFMVDSETAHTILFAAGLVCFVCALVTIIGVMHKPADDLEIIGNKNYLTPTDKIFCLIHPTVVMPFLLLVLVSVLPN
jgi:membrane protease YdiL (CAAX protease family)